MARDRVAKATGNSLKNSVRFRGAKSSCDIGGLHLMGHIESCCICYLLLEPCSVAIKENDPIFGLQDDQLLPGGGVPMGSGCQYQVKTRRAQKPTH
jgi:hypothetical protein